MSNQISFKSYCWSIGTTSYRTERFNLNIELQLKLLKEFRNLPQNKGKIWTGNTAFQKEYYEFLRDKDFVKGDAERPDKDAREKTSGLRDIGLLDNERNLTEAGEALLEISESNDFDSDNLLEIPRDSYLYFRQLLKASNDIDGKTVRPFPIFLYIVNRLEYLTYDEFTYLLPLCVDRETTSRVIESIVALREGEIQYEDIIWSVLLEMENYKAALSMIKRDKVTEELICNIGFNRKSAKYDKPHRLYQGNENFAYSNIGVKAAAQIQC